MAFAGSSFPEYVMPFGHAVPDWDFRVAENPAAPGEYRWPRFAWKALEHCTGMSLGIGVHGATIAVSAGDASWPPGTVAAEHRTGTVATQWSLVRVDLWALLKTAAKQPPPLQELGLLTAGAGALFDQIVLGRTEADLPAPPSG